jgi:hypothetical protein
METNRGPRRSVLLALTLLLLVAACSGPDTGDDADPTPTPLPTATATETPMPTPEPTETPEPEATATAESGTVPSAEGTAATEEAPQGTETAPADATPTEEVPQIGLVESLPTLEEVPGEGFVLANQGSQTALELANAYTDSAAHLERLTSWGFAEHHFREFGREAAGPEDPVPNYVLTTVNVYGSPELADEAIAWFDEFNRLRGYQDVNPPAVGDNSIASTVPTADGTPTAITFIRLGSRVYVYFASGGHPMPLLTEMAQNTFARITAPPEQG